MRLFADASHMRTKHHNTRRILLDLDAEANTASELPISIFLRVQFTSTELSTDNKQRRFNARHVYIQTKWMSLKINRYIFWTLHVKPLSFLSKKNNDFWSLLVETGCILFFFKKWVLYRSFLLQKHFKLNTKVHALNVTYHSTFWSNTTILHVIQKKVVQVPGSYFGG